MELNEDRAPGPRTMTPEDRANWDGNYPAVPYVRPPKLSDKVKAWLGKGKNKWYAIGGFVAFVVFISLISD